MFICHYCLCVCVFNVYVISVCILVQLFWFVILNVSPLSLGKLWAILPFILNIRTCRNTIRLNFIDCFIFTFIFDLISLPFVMCMKLIVRAEHISSMNVLRCLHYCLFEHTEHHLNLSIAHTETHTHTLADRGKEWKNAHFIQSNIHPVSHPKRSSTNKYENVSEFYFGIFKYMFFGILMDIPCDSIDVL